MKKRVLLSIAFISGLCTCLSAQTSCNANAGEPITMTFDVCPDDLAVLSFDGIFNNPSGIYTDADGNSENVATINALIAVNEMTMLFLSQKVLQLI